MQGLFSLSVFSGPERLLEFPHPFTRSIFAVAPEKVAVRSRRLTLGILAPTTIARQ